MNIALGLDRLQRQDRIEPFRGADHAGAVGDTGEVAQHHSETVVIRHRNAQPVVRRQAHRPADEIAVVDDVVMSQRGALRRPGGAGGELDVDRVVELQRRAEGGERPALVLGGRPGDVVEIEHPGRFLIP